MSFDEVHARMEAKAKASKAYFLDVWLSHISQLSRLTNDTSFTWTDYVGLREGLLKVAGENWERDNG